jgi:hypothetical protein
MDEYLVRHWVGVQQVERVVSLLRVQAGDAEEALLLTVPNRLLCAGWRLDRSDGAYATLANPTMTEQAADYWDAELLEDYCDLG